jgi:hypothetical protein
MIELQAERLRRLAYEENIPTLFKFRNFGTEDEKAWTREILLTQDPIFPTVAVE